MITRTFANTDIHVSAVSYGAIKIGRNQKMKYPSPYDLPSDKECADIIALCKELGMNLIDTAPAYGSSEKRLGKILKGQRQDWLLSSKLGEEFENGESSFNFTPEWAEKSIERSLKRLGTDYLDILFIHSDGYDLDVLALDEFITKLHDFKKRGLVRAIGASTKTKAGGLKALELLDCAMVSYNLNYLDEEAVIDQAAKENKGIFLKKALASGHIVSEKAMTDPIQASFDFALKKKGVTSAVIGSINPVHLKENIDKALLSLS